MDAKTAEYWEDQAELAKQFALARPASDLKGFLLALREAAEFQRLAAEARNGGVA